VRTCLRGKVPNMGEDQIITQVRNAIELAREMNASDSTLEVMFRIAVTSAKK